MLFSQIQQEHVQSDKVSKEYSKKVNFNIYTLSDAF